MTLAPPSTMLTLVMQLLRLIDLRDYRIPKFIYTFVQSFINIIIQYYGELISCKEKRYLAHRYERSRYRSLAA